MGKAKIKKARVLRVIEPARPTVGNASVVTIVALLLVETSRSQAELEVVAFRQPVGSRWEFQERNLFTDEAAAALDADLDLAARRAA